MDEEDFEPRLGRIGGKAGRKGRKYAALVAAAAHRAAVGRPGPSRRFDGSRIGRGAGIGRVAGRGTRDRTRRVVVKARLVRLSAKGLGAARAHLRYIQRDGVTRDGRPGML